MDLRAPGVQSLARRRQGGWASSLGEARLDKRRSRRRVGESRSQSAMVVATRNDTSGSLDVLAGVMRRALSEGLLP